MTTFDSTIITFEEGCTIIKDDLQKAMHELSHFNDKKSPRLRIGQTGYIQTYTTCYNMCTQKYPFNWSEKLYSFYGTLLSDYLLNHMKPMLDLVANHTVDDLFLFNQFYQCLMDYKFVSSYLKRVFCYLDRYYTPEKETRSALPSLLSINIKLFQEIAFNDEMKNLWFRRIQSHLEQASLQGTHTEWGLLKACTLICKEFDVNTDQLETCFSESLYVYCCYLSTQWIRSDDGVSNEEQDQWPMVNSTIENNIELYLYKSRSFIECLEQQLIVYFNDAEEVQRLVKMARQRLSNERQGIALFGDENSGKLSQMLQDEQYDILREIFSCFHEEDCLYEKDWLVVLDRILCAHFTKKIKACLCTWMLRKRAFGSEETKQRKIDEMFKALFAIHLQYSGIVKEKLDSYWLFKNTQRNCFINVISNAQCSDKDEEPIQSINGELMATVCNQLLKCGGGDKDEMHRSLDMMAQLSTYLLDQDVFVEIYRQHLAKRLLASSSTVHYEEYMIKQLTAEYGTQFTVKLRVMLTDMTTDEHHHGAFSTNLLTQGFWPSFPLPHHVPISYPSTIQQQMKSFQDGFLTIYPEKKLEWIWSQGHAIVHGVWDKDRTYDFQLTTLQAVVLLTLHQLSGYGDDENACMGNGLVSFTAIRETVHLPNNILKRVLHSFTCSEKRDNLLLKFPPSSPLKQTDCFKVNRKFSSNSSSFRVPMASLTTSTTSSINRSLATSTQVEDVRNSAIDAALVRIMKASKCLKHPELISAVFVQIKLFRPTPKQIKARIENLIEREYIQRDGVHSDKYLYTP